MKTLPQARLAAPDCLRGLFLVAILFEHVRQILCGVIFREAAASPGLQSTGDFQGWIRAASHPCAPGFFFLLGMGMVLWESRHPATTASRWRHFMTRGLLLVLAQVLLENPAWAVPLLLQGNWAATGCGALYLGVLFTLGTATVIGCAMLRLPGRFLLPVAVLLVCSPQLAPVFPIPPWASWLFIDTTTASIDVPFPVLPWTGIALLGIVYARNRFVSSAESGGGLVVKPMPGRVAVVAGAVCVIGAYAVAAACPSAFSKYPPSPLFSFGMLAIVIALFEVFASIRIFNEGALRLLGRHSLVAYLLPLYLAGLATWGGRRESAFAIIVTAAVVSVVTVVACLIRERGRDNFSFFAPGYDVFMRRSGLYRADELRRELAGHASGGSLLDVAGGTGYLAARLSDVFRRVVVVDLSPGMLAIAQRRKLATVCASASTLPFDDGDFDAVLCVDALHHIADRDGALDEMARVLKPGGIMLIQDFEIRGLRGFLFLAFEWLLIDRSRFMAPNHLLETMARRNFQGRIRKLSPLGYLYTGIKS